MQGRKVGTTQGAILPNGKAQVRECGQIPAFAGTRQTVPQKITVRQLADKGENVG